MHCANRFGPKNRFYIALRVRKDKKGVIRAVVRVPIIYLWNGEGTVKGWVATGEPGSVEELADTPLTVFLSTV